MLNAALRQASAMAMASADGMASRRMLLWLSVAVVGNAWYCIRSWDTPAPSRSRAMAALTRPTPTGAAWKARWLTKTVCEKPTADALPADALPAAAGPPSQTSAVQVSLPPAPPQLLTMLVRL